MSEITEKDVKRLWVEKDAVCVELPRRLRWRVV